MSDVAVAILAGAGLALVGYLIEQAVKAVFRRIKLWRGS